MSAPTTWDAVTARALPSRVATHLHLLRHGAAETGGARRCYGHADLPLSPEGEAQTAALVPFVAERLPRPDGVWCSDLARCRALGEALAGALGLPLTLDRALREQHMGDWEGRTWSDLTAEDPAAVHAFWADPFHAAPPGGESLGALAARVVAAAAARVEARPGARWLVVSHAGPLRALLAWGLRLPPTELLRLAPAPGTHSHLTLAEAGGVLHTLGEHPRAAAPPAGPRRGAGRLRRIALTGSAGTGKTTLGRALSAATGLPYIPEGMRERIEAGLDLHTLGRDGLRALIGELWAEQRAREDAAIAQHGGFVADRSPVDYAAFYLTYGFVEPADAPDAFFAATAAPLAALDALVVLPWGALPLAADGVRTPNPWTQRRFQATVEGLAARAVPADRLLWLPPLTDLDARVAWVLAHGA